MAVSANDCLHWFNHWAWTDDPREPNSLMPFDLFPHQGDYLLWLVECELLREDGVAEKSRDVGFTWLCIGYALWRWLFKKGFKAGFGSRKLDLVDKLGDPDTIFEKGRILLRNIPVWMLPTGFKFGTHDGYCKIRNPANGASITGEGGDQIGRGGRKSIYFVDESAFLARPMLVERSLSANTNVRIDVSTPNGVGNPFEKKRHGGNVRVFTFHWRDDPRKTEEWAVKKKRTVDPVTWAQEYEIDYSASIEGICIPAAWVRAAVDYPIHKYVRQDLPIVGGFDPADGGRARSVLIGRKGPLVLKPKSWTQLSSGQAAGQAKIEAESLGMVRVNFDAIGVGTSVSEAWLRAEQKPTFEANGIKWGDPPTKAVWPSGKTSVDMFVNLRTELWWTARTRFEKTWQVVNEDADWPPEELISIPNCPELISDLSIPLIKTTPAGKLLLESKDDMALRGVASPDHGDALCYTFAPAQRLQMDFF